MSMPKEAIIYPTVDSEKSVVRVMQGLGESQKLW